MVPCCHWWWRHVTCRIRRSLGKERIKCQIFFMPNSLIRVTWYVLYYVISYILYYCTTYYIISSLDILLCNITARNNASELEIFSLQNTCTHHNDVLFKEKSLGYAPKEMMDRQKASIPKLQVEFVSKVALPAYQWVMLAFLFQPSCVTNVVRPLLGQERERESSREL